VSGTQPGGEAYRRTASANIVADYLLHKQLMSANERRTLNVYDALLLSASASAAAAAAASSHVSVVER